MTKPVETTRRFPRASACCVALLAMAMALAFAALSNAMVLTRSLNDLVDASTAVAVGRVEAVSHEVIEGHAWTKVTLAQEAYPETGASVAPVEFWAPGGPIGDQIELVSDTPSFRIGERALVMLRAGASGRARLVHGLQSKIDISDTGAVRGSSQSLASLLSDIRAIRQGAAIASIAAPEPMTPSMSAALAAGEPLPNACCGYLTDDDGQPVRWSGSCPSISFWIYNNSGVAGASTAIQQAATSWNAAACSCARLVYAGTASGPGDSICSWASLSDDATIAMVTTWYNASVPHTITKFELQFNTHFAWTASCGSNAMDVETIALHELGHVLAMDDQYSASCSSYTMYGSAYTGLCKHDPSLDAACLAGLYPASAALNSFSINNGAASTSSTAVKLNNVASCSATHYMASESSSFSGASWLTYSSAPSFTLSSSLGTKTVYLKVKNAKGTSSTLSDTITLAVSLTPPSDPGATNLAMSSIRWTWTDNSSNETGFRVYADAGSAAPTTLRTTTAANAAYWDYTGLAANTQYAFQVATTNGTSDSAKTTNLARYTLATTPTYGASGNGKITCDKGSGGSTWYLPSTSVTFTAVNGFGSGPAKASSYRYVWNTAAGEPSWTGASTWASGSLVRTPSSTGTYYLHIQAANADSAYNTTTLHLGPYMVDAGLPSTPMVFDAGAYQSSTSQIHADWTATDSASGICEYQYAVGTSPSSLVVQWKSAGLNLGATESGLALQPGSVYYWYVKARDCAGNWSVTTASDGIMVVTHPASSVDAAKSLPDGATAGLDAKTVTAITDTGFYVQDGPPWVGIRVDSASAGIAVGNLVDIGGTLSTSPDGEKLITGIAALKPGTSAPHAVGLANRSMGGGSRNYESETGAGQRGTEGGVGLNNVGMLLRAWGRMLSSGAAVIRSWDFDTDPGFALQGMWAWGTPTGGGSSCHDPTSGYTGTRVLGYNLSGDYADNMFTTMYATTPAVDCSGYTSVHLRFRRWLGVESSPYDYATIQVSNDATNWTTIYSNGTSFCNGAWLLVDYDISAVADRKSGVYVRWGMGPTDTSVTYPGWNIDDVELNGIGGVCLIDDGSGSGLRLEFPKGMALPAQGSYLSATGICSCLKDTQGKVWPVLKVTSWEPH